MHLYNLVWAHQWHHWHVGVNRFAMFGAILREARGWNTKVRPMHSPFLHDRSRQLAFLFPHVERHAFLFGFTVYWLTFDPGVAHSA